MKRLSILAIVVLTATIAVGIASAVVTSAILADTNVVREKIVRTQFTPSADQPTFAAGWHMHPGLAVVQVQEGRLTIIQNCRSTRLRPGDTFVEVPYLPVNAVATESVKWTTTFVLADSIAGAPDRLPATDPACQGEDDGGDHERGGH
jgi:energy-converting hydrogenase Eha subunit A